MLNPKPDIIHTHILNNKNDILYWTIQKCIWEPHNLPKYLMKWKGILLIPLLLKYQCHSTRYNYMLWDNVCQNTCLTIPLPFQNYTFSLARFAHNKLILQYFNLNNLGPICRYNFHQSTAPSNTTVIEAIMITEMLNC